MSDLIKREDAVKITWIEPQYSDPINVLTEVRDRIKALPTVDAVPVVRCKDCKHHEVFKNGVNGWCNGHGCPADVTYFCADGERRTE